MDESKQVISRLNDIRWKISGIRDSFWDGLIDIIKERDQLKERQEFVKVKNLAQQIYEDSHGQPFPADKIDCITTYTPPVDGFYSAACGRCGEGMGTRHFKFFGIVHRCTKCGAYNLLVRTDPEWVHKQITDSQLSKKEKEELERLRGIEKYNKEQLAFIKSYLVNKVNQTLYDEIKDVTKVKTQ